VGQFDAAMMVYFLSGQWCIFTPALTASNPNFLDLCQCGYIFSPLLDYSELIDRDIFSEQLLNIRH
jgi:hypothetical protein